MLKIMADPINILTRDKTHMRERANKKKERFEIYYKKKMRDVRYNYERCDER